MESYQILPDVSLHTAGADLSPFHHVAAGVGGPAVRAIVHFPTGGEQQAAAGEGETFSSKKCGKGAVLSVLAQEVTLVHDIDVGNNGQDVLLNYLTGLTFGCASAIREPWDQQIILGKFLLKIHALSRAEQSRAVMNSEAPITMLPHSH